MDRTELEKLPEPIREAHAKIKCVIVDATGIWIDAKQERRLVLALRRMHLQTKLETMEELNP